MLKSVATTTFACVVLEHSIAINLATPDKFARTPRFLQRLDKQLGLPNIIARVMPLGAIPTARVQPRIRPTASPVQRVKRWVKSGGGGGMATASRSGWWGTSKDVPRPRPAIAADQAP